MKEWLWINLAKWIVASPQRVQWIIDRAQKTPYFNLPGYMNRWWLVMPSSRLPFAVRVHHILRRDHDRDPHNHPWAFRTIILDGWYDEALLQPDGSEDVRRVHAGMTQARDTKQYHRIEKISEGGVWTLFFMEKKSGEWGFLQNGKHIHWREYLNEWDENV